MFEKIIEWCEKTQKHFAYDRGTNWCDCVDFTDYINLHINDGYILTIYYYPTRNTYGCRLMYKKDLIATLENVNEPKDIINFVEGYNLVWNTQSNN